MFTGIIEHVGTLAELEAVASGYRVRIETPVAKDLKQGDSIAVNGVCLTATSIDDRGFSADVGPETARITTLASLQRDRLVNLERPLRLDAMLGGHLVQGHIDGVGTIEDVRADGESRWLTIGYPPPLAPYFIRKGSVALDGISLTIARLGATQLDVQVIPFTWAHTSLRAAKSGDKVNLECDMIGKYVARAIELAGDGMGKDN